MYNDLTQLVGRGPGVIPEHPPAEVRVGSHRLVRSRGALEQDLQNGVQVTGRYRSKLNFKTALAPRS